MSSGTMSPGSPNAVVPYKRSLLRDVLVNEGKLFASRLALSLSFATVVIVIALMMDFASDRLPVIGRAISDASHQISLEDLAVSLLIIFGLLASTLFAIAYLSPAIEWIVTRIQNVALRLLSMLANLIAYIGRMPRVGRIDNALRYDVPRILVYSFLASRKIDLEMWGDHPVVYAGSKLRIFDFGRMKLVNALFLHCDLSWSSMKAAQLSHAHFHDCRMVWVDLSDATLTGASFARSTLRNVDLRDANMDDVDFDRASLYMVNVRNTNLSKAKNITIEQIRNSGFEYDDDTTFPKSIQRLLISNRAAGAD